MPDPYEFVYPLPTASPFEDYGQYIPLLLAAVDHDLGQETMWAEADWPTAIGYIEDLKAWLVELPNLMSGGIPIGSVQAFAGSEVPAKWLLCDGAAVSRTTYAALFAAIGTIYGAGDGITTFNLPDLRGRTVIGTGQGSGLTNRPLGVSVGAETHTLSVAEMPSHTHTVYGRQRAADGTARASLAAVSDNANANTMPEGGGQPHNNMQPSLALRYLIYAGS